MIDLVEDDPSIRKLVSYALESSGYTVAASESGEEMWKKLETVKPELFLLDIMLPGQSGLDILTAIRSDPSLRDIPVIMLTAKGTEYDKVLGLDSGADDYIPKPFGMMELLSRIRAVLRRYEHPKDRIDISYGKIVISPASHTVRVDGEKVELTLKEFNLLLYLMENEGYENKEGCYSYSWWGSSFDIDDHDIRILGPEYLESITSVYAIDSEDSIRELLRKGRISGLFIEGKLAGFVGFHSEGSMGMLQVFDEYRKHGYGELMEKHDINWALSENRIPYCHVFFSNQASINLQNKLGLVCGEKPIWWVWKDN